MTLYIRKVIFVNMGECFCYLTCDISFAGELMLNYFIQGMNVKLFAFLSGFFINCKDQVMVKSIDVF